MIGNFKKATPEEKLLHIIERPEEISKLDINMRNKKHKLSRLKSRISLSAFKKMSFEKVTLRSVNKVLLWVCAIVTLALVAYFVKEEKYLQIRFDNLKRESLKGNSIQIFDKKKDIPNISTYLRETEGKNPFHVLPVVVKPKPQKTKPKVDLKLVGIIWSDKPQAIIEDSASKKSYLVYAGDKVGKFEVTEITSTEVKLTSEDGEKILR